MCQPVIETRPDEIEASEMPATNGDAAPLCLRFANTVAQRPGTPSAEVITSYHTFAGWLQREGVLGGGDVDRLVERADREPEEARRTLERAGALREAIRGLFERIGRGRPPEAGDVDLLDREWREARSRLRLVRRGARFSAQFPPGGTSLARPLWTLATSGAELLLSDRLERVKVCDAPDCTHLFLDTSRNRSRRWCDMSICGNRMKARRHYHRHRDAG